MENTSSLLLSFEAEMEDRLSPAARLFHSPKFSCYIVIRMGCSIRINPEVISAGLKEILYKHPRFSSKNGKHISICVSFVIKCTFCSLFYTCSYKVVLLLLGAFLFPNFIRTPHFKHRMVEAMDVKRRKDGKYKRPTCNQKQKIGQCHDEYLFSNKDPKPNSKLGSSLFRSPKFSCYIVLTIGSKTRINLEVVKAGLKQNFPDHPCFSSIMVYNSCFSLAWLNAFLFLFPGFAFSTWILVYAISMI
ncbi:putative transferase [Rosa chinensis]|uniref:Putative transferase n=1 Tax=Rosa chinensis TaxID=74649 RepID=A0A2P6SP07_ROSCH|nr:putative transferase [Rosa chinensis]